MHDFMKYTIIGCILFATNLAIGYVSDKYTLFTGVQLTIILTTYNFFGRYALMKQTKFNKKEVNI